MEIRIFLLAVMFWCFEVYAQNLEGKIIGVKDGDTVVMLYRNTPITIRIEHIDCPEKKQPFGQKAKQFTSDFCFGKKVTFTTNGKKDRNGRWIGELFSKNQNLGKELLKHGLAWHYKKYSKNKIYSDLELIARKNKVGLWGDALSVEPRIWRKMGTKNDSFREN